MVKPKFYDMNVHSIPDGKNTPQQTSILAKHFGYAGIAITNHSNIESKPTGFKSNGFEVFKGIEVVSNNPSKLHGLIGKYRRNVDVLVIHGGNENINRAAVENRNVDILAHPCTPKDSGLNHILAKSASENNVAIEFNLDSVFKGRGGRRVHTLSYFRKNVEIARKFDVPMILTSNAASYFDLRAPWEMIALAGLFGMEKDEAISAISTVPAGIIARNRPGPGFIREGVEEIIEEVNSKDSSIDIDNIDSEPEEAGVSN
ncbi:MAG TPA: ribonuclease P protein component 3 [Methanosarcinaceae archaeon]|nr:ribonuclease P protein component 3 [Methanosarcinaceae archaeon]HJH32728.1 ribonuclease P protein component 3 [Methanosarcinaceae archaeon]